VNRRGERTFTPATRARLRKKVNAFPGVARLASANHFAGRCGHANILRASPEPEPWDVPITTGITVGLRIGDDPQPGIPALEKGKI